MIEHRAEPRWWSLLAFPYMAWTIFLGADGTRWEAVAAIALIGTIVYFLSFPSRLRYAIDTPPFLLWAYVSQVALAAVLFFAGRGFAAIF